MLMPILLVIPHNAIASLADNPCAVKCGGTTWAAMLLVNVGWIGVQIFFVLSGFLITRNLLDSLGAPNYYRAFYVRRALRILPLYYGTLAVVFLLLPLVGLHPLGDDGGARDRLWFWVFLSNWSVPLGAAACGLPHFWSLAVEEQFYLAWPALVRRVTAVACPRGRSRCMSAVRQNRHDGIIIHHTRWRRSAAARPSSPYPRSAASA